MHPKSTLLTLGAVGMAVIQAQEIYFGPYYSLGATNSYIVEAETTLYPGETPDPQKARLALWPGMGTDAGNLIQAIVLSSTDAQAVDCGGSTRVEGEWCVFASVLQDDVQLSGDTYPITSDQGVTINYKYDESTGNTTQTLTVDGQVVSTYSSNSGKAIGWGTAVECQDDACDGTVYAHSYENTRIQLAAADSGFAGTLATNEVTATTLQNSGSTTFTVDTIDVHEYTFDY